MGTIQGKLLAVLVLVLLASGGTGLFVHRYDAGQEAERNLAASRQYAETIRKAEDDARAKEAGYANALAAASAAHQIDLKERDDAHAKALAVARSDGLYVSAKCPASGSSVSEASPGSSGGDGSSRVQLSQSAADFAISLASEADAVADQLRECQAVVRADRQ